MKKFEFKLIENYMLDCMKYMSHDKDHIYRVLFIAIDIASHEENVDTDILIAACILHDIGRSEQFSDEKENHAKVGAKKAYELLLSKAGNFIKWLYFTNISFIRSGIDQRYIPIPYRIPHIFHINSYIVDYIQKQIF